MSPKPWAKTEIGYMRHQKFLALSANAICLWHEGKGYCDEHLTDGIIPKEAIKTFRFRGQKAMEQLLTSCGPKPNGEPFAPLWEPHALGYRMHDYLEHNDCRDAVLARMERADERREEDRARKAEAREAKRLRASAKSPQRNPHGNPQRVPSKVRSTTAPVPETKEPNDLDASAARPHPVRDFLKLYDQLFFDLHGEHPQIVGGRDAKIAKTAITDFTEEKARKLLELFFSSSDPFIRKSGYGLNIFSGQTNKLLTELGRSRAPIRAVWVCPHVDSCGHRAMCEVKLANPQKYPVRESSQVAS